MSFVDNGDGTATLAGTPDAGTGGTYVLTITATNGVAPDATQTFTLTVTRRAPAITSGRPHDVHRRRAGHVHGDHHGFPAAALTETGVLPAGVTFVDNGDGTATLAGTPAAGTGGTYTLTITATNGVAPDATQSFTLTVTTPGAGDHQRRQHDVHRRYAGTFTVTTTGFPARASETGALPAGVTFVDNRDGTATLAGTPAAGSGGTYALTITATNGVAPDATQTFTLTVNPGPRSPRPTTPPSPSGGGYVHGDDHRVPDAGIEKRRLPTGVTFVDNRDGTATLRHAGCGHRRRLRADDHRHQRRRTRRDPDLHADGSNAAAPRSPADNTASRWARRTSR